MLKWKLLYNIPLSQQLSKTATFKKEGWRPGSICLHSHLTDPYQEHLYSSIWVKWNKIVPWDIKHLATEYELQTYID